MNILNEAMTAQADIEEAQRLEQTRRQGYDFIRVRYYGRIPTIIEPGTNKVINLRIKEVHDVIVYFEPDPETGTSKPHTRIGTSEIKFRQDRISGDIIADVLDDEYNRYFIARHLEFGIEPVDKKMRREIQELADKKYKVEVSKSESLLREKRRIEKELAALGTEAILDDDDEETVKKKKHRKERHAYTAKLNQQKKAEEAEKKKETQQEKKEEPQPVTSDDDSMI